MGWRKVVRRFLAWSVGPPLVILATVSGTGLALLYSAPGRSVTVRAVNEFLTTKVAGELSIGSFRGSLFRHAVLEDVMLSDSNGVVLLDAPRLEARYFLPELLAGRIIIRELDLERPTIHLARLRKQRWNYEEVFRKSYVSSDGPGSRVELRNVTVNGGNLRIDSPTESAPPRRALTRNAKTPVQREMESTDDGLVRVYRASDLSGRFELMRLSTPDRDPILILIDSLNTQMNDPAVSITDMAGQILTGGDSLLFEFRHAAMPASRLAGGGAVRWPNGPLLFDFSLTADTISLSDLHWVQPDFPDWTGRGQVVARSSSSSHTEYRLDDLVLGGAGARAVGSLTAITDDYQGFGVSGLDMEIRGVPLETFRPYLDTIPFAGELSGRIAASGYAARLDLEGELDFEDQSPESFPTSRLVFDGDLLLSGESGAVFENFVLRSTVVDLATVEELIPSVQLPGNLRLVGRLDGPWKDVSFQGTAEHMAVNNALSRLTGVVGLDTRGTVLDLAMDARFDRLSFDGLRTGYPNLTPRGGVVGPVKTAGRLDSLWVDAQLSGEIGEVDLLGTLGITSPGYRFDSLRLDLRRFDLQAFLGSGSNTAISGIMEFQGVIDSGVSPQGRVELALGQTRVGGVTLDRLSGVVNSRGGILDIDSLEALWAEGRVSAAGSLGWTGADSGRLLVDAVAESLSPIDSLVRAFLPIDPDTIAPNLLDGSASAQLEVYGALSDLALSGSLFANDIVLDSWRVGELRAIVSADSLSTLGLSIDATVDSVTSGEYLASDLAVKIQRASELTHFSARGNLRDAAFKLGGTHATNLQGSITGIDSMHFDFPRQSWRLERPLTTTVTEQGIVLSEPAVLTTTVGSGSMIFSGSVPGVGSGELHASVVGFDVQNIFAALRPDTNQVGGLASADFRLSGSRSDPSLRGNAMVTGPTFRGSNPPLVRAAFDYSDRLLRSNLTFWKTGQPVLDVDMSLPFDLALQSTERRRLPGPIDITAYADSAELAILEAFTPNLRNTIGHVALDLTVAGTWEAPRLGGDLSVIGGRTSLPSLRVRYGPINGHATFTGDSMVVDSLRAVSGGGGLLVDGLVQFEDLNRPILDLELQSEGFLAIDVPGFLSLRPTGTATLKGPLWQPVLSGNTVRVDDSELYFADLLNKDVLNLEDPKYSDLVDAEEIRDARLGAAFQNRFLDSLRIDNLPFRVGTNVWLRSSEADIQLEGEVRVNKVRRNYRLTGTFNTPRGRYTLGLGPIFRDFVVNSGTVRYSGTPDLNADLDVTAVHSAATAFGDELQIVARIGGSILVPVVTLSSPDQNYTEKDLIAYMVFGQPESRLGSVSTGGFALQTALRALTGEFQRTLVQDKELLGLDVLEFRPTPGATTESGTFAKLAAGWQLGSRWFVTLNAGFCFGGQEKQQLSAENFGASVEYRLASAWRVQGSAEPVQSCLGGRLGDAFSNISRRYQLGADLLWEKEY